MGTRSCLVIYFRILLSERCLLLEMIGHCPMFLWHNGFLLVRVNVTYLQPWKCYQWYCVLNVTWYDTTEGYCKLCVNQYFIPCNLRLSQTLGIIILQLCAGISSVTKVVQFGKSCELELVEIAWKKKWNRLNAVNFIIEIPLI